eukprot:969611-Lingulodinium_polyedra.AAC.1
MSVPTAFGASSRLLAAGRASAAASNASRCTTLACRSCGGHGRSQFSIVGRSLAAGLSCWSERRALLLVGRSLAAGLVALLQH